VTKNQRLVLSFFDEDPSRTLVEIGELVGVSKQAVYVCLNKLRPGWRREHERAVEEARVNALAKIAPPETHPCAVCGVPVRKTRRTCGGDCAKAWNSLRWHLDPEFRKAQRHRIAAWMLANPTRVTPGSVTWAKRVIKDNGPAPPSKWTVAGGVPASYVDAISELPREEA